MTRFKENPRLFTVEEANRSLPYVRRVVADVLDEHRALQRLLPRLRGARIRARRGEAQEELEQLRRRVAELSGRLEAYLGEIRNVGCVLRGETGVVDFHSILDGRLVCLCWRFDETEVAHWHELDEDWRRRRSLDEPVLSEAGPGDSDG